MKRLFLAAGAVLIAGPAFAQQTVGDLVTSTNDNALGPVADLLLNVAWVAGLGFVLFGIFSLWRNGRAHHGEGMQAGKLVAMFIGGAALIAFPATVGVGPASIFGGDAETSAIGGQLRSLGD